MSRTSLAASLLAAAACAAPATDTNPVDACPSPVNGCTADAFAAGDLTAQATPTVTFANFAYTPRCITVTTAQEVTISGDFGSHPIQQTCGPVVAVPPMSSGGELKVTFSTAGTYGYWCVRHHSSDDMAGAVLVKAP